LRKLLPYVSFRGRAGRKEFWRAVGLSAVICLMGVILAVATAAMPSDVMAAGFVLAVVPILAASLVWVAAATRRLRDRNRSTMSSLLLIVGPQQLWSLASYIGDFTGSIYLKPALSIFAVGVGAWAFVELGLLRGTTGPNRYGPDPLQSPTAEVFN
jgi:uncharacterized membrane protein YhaH (DUF805 family)